MAGQWAGRLAAAAAITLGMVAGVPAARAHTDAVAAAPVYIVTSADTWQGIQAIAQAAQQRRGAGGQALVIARVAADQLDAVAGYVHEHEQRCGGFFAFESLAAAEAFVANDRSADAIALPLGGIYTVDNHATVDPWLDQVAEANIHATITSLSAFRNRYYASSYGQQAAEWIRDSWQALAAGRSDVTVELFTDCSTCSTQPSVIMTLQGHELADDVVVVGGHLDSINQSGGGSQQLAPGADDDASGIATITEIARIALASGWQPRRTIKFMGYAAEEVGLNGSEAIAASFAADGINVVGVLQLDMTNYKDGTAYDMQRISDHSNSALKAYFGDLFAAYLTPRGLVLSDLACGYGCSDHASWTAQGFPAGMMFEAGRPRTPGNPWDLGDFPYIHTSGDTLANMDNSAQHSVKFAQFGLAFIGELGKTHEPELPPNEAPSAAFSYTRNGMSVQFTDASSDSDGTIVARLWDFGDGSTSTASNPLKTWTAVGTWPVSLTVTDDGGLPNLHIESVQVDNGTVVLANGVAQAGLPALQGADQDFTLDVPAGASGLQFTLTGVAGEDADIEVSFAGQVRCSGQGATANEACAIADPPDAGTWQVRVHAYSALSAFSIVGAFAPQDDTIFADGYEL